MSFARLASITALLLAPLACTGDTPEGSASNSGTESDSSTSTSSSTATTSASGATMSGTSMSGTESATGSSTSGTTAPETTSSGSTTDAPTSSTTDMTTGTTGVDPTTTGDTTTGTTGVDPTTTGGTTGMMEDPCPCADVEVPLDNGIFVLSDNAELWKYLPETNTFEMLGAVGCNNMKNTFSMAVDRAGYAWVMFNPPAGDIWKVDVTNPANCIDPGYTPGQMGATLYGMAFVSKDIFNTCDQLYGNTYNGIGGFGEGQNFGNFLTVDPDNLSVSILGPTTFNGAELTGTGDGRVFMFGGVNPAKLVEVDKANGQYIDVTPLGNLNLTNAFAFAFFAGDFYFFTESGGPGSKSKVTHYDYDDSDNNGIKDLTVVNMNAPIRIVGAGVSTCAPFLPQ
ncbi:MAG: hypothetical protein KC420_10520 [Myxococcales bacterium]|nr:hypothetical protein [Myxococcales bacterium]MCB9567879.1 hypothetical protein [Myxococcales bacterium]